LHYQKGRAAQAKLITCVKGGIYDVILDMRKGSRTYLKWAAVRLSQKNRLVLYVPRGFAHGYLSFAKGTVVLYKADNHYSPAAEAGVRWDDPALGIRWPVKKPVLSEKDKAWQNLRVQP
jgi:dTDP-4-dehydrorhamnose 3,5-epimerase